MEVSSSQPERRVVGQFEVTFLGVVCEAPALETSALIGMRVRAVPADTRISFHETSGSRECPAVGMQHATATDLMPVIRAPTTHAKYE